ALHLLGGRLLLRELSELDLGQPALRRIRHERLIGHLLCRRGGRRLRLFRLRERGRHRQRERDSTAENQLVHSDRPPLFSISAEFGGKSNATTAEPYAIQRKSLRPVM